MLGVAIAIDPLIMTRNALLDGLPADKVKDEHGHYTKEAVVGATILLIFIAYTALRIDNVFNGLP